MVLTFSLKLSLNANKQLPFIENYSIVYVAEVKKKHLEIIKLNKLDHNGALTIRTIWVVNA